MPMHLSAMLTSLPLDFESAARQAAALHFTHADVIALKDRPQSHREALADTGLLVSCAALGRGLPEGCSLDAVALAARQSALAEVKRQIADAGSLGATRGYLVPGTDSSPAALARFTEACELLAEYAGQRMMRLCIEPVPGRAMRAAAEVLSWLAELDHPNLFLLLDVGHCLIAQEDAAQVVSRAGARLGYVHFDDNDGQGDLHWPLLTGRLSKDMLRATLTALQKQGYDGALALELNPANAEPVQALAEGKALLTQLARETGWL